MCTLKLIPLPNFSSLGWFSLLSAVKKCWQLLTADGSWYEKNLMEFLCTDYSLYLCQISALLVNNHFHQLLSGVISCWQLMTADITKIWLEYLWNVTGIFMYTLNLICRPNFSFLGWCSFSSAFTTCNQLLTADDNW